MANILIVDDELSIRRTLAEFLRDDGHDVVEAADADAALRALEQRDVDVVVTDIILPGLSGVELLQRIRNVRPHVPVVMMTGEPNVHTASESLRAGAIEYLFKPVGKAAIRRVATHALRIKTLDDAKRRLEAENRAYQLELERLVQDRTCQLRASEAQARELARFNQAALDALTAHICILDDAGRILAVNRAWRDFAVANPPLPGGADVGCNYLAVCEGVEGDAAQDAGAALRGLKAVAAGVTCEFALEYDCHSPEVKRWFVMRATRFAWDGPARIVVAHTDITARKLAERRTADALAFSRSVIDSAPVGIATYRAAGEPLSINEAMAKAVGVSRKELAAGNFRQQPHWKDTGLLVAADEALATRTEQRLEAEWTLASGRHVSLACQLVPFSYAGEPHLLLLATDLTEKKAAATRLLRAQRVESIGSLASGVAHDLNNILTPIVMCASMLGAEETEEGRLDLARTIETSAQRAVGVVRQLLTFARGKEGPKVAVPLRPVIRDLVALARETFPRSIRIEEVCAPDLAPVRADATQLHQVLLNLGVNARDAMPSGGTLTIRATNVSLDEQFVSMHPEAREGPFVLVEVVDTGAGISEREGDRIFESFFTTKDEGAGTGLGLTVARGIVRDHKGFMTYASSPGKGTTFQVYLPAAERAESSGDVAPELAKVPRAHGELVLLVDDEANIRDATGRALESHGYRVLAAGDGIEALALFSSNAGVDAVVTDLVMPLMDGITLCRTLHRLSPGTPLIVSSGALLVSAGVDALRALDELGVSHVLQKPYNAEALLRMLHDVLTACGDPQKTVRSGATGTTGMAGR